MKRKRYIVGISLAGLALGGTPETQAQRFEAGPPALIQASDRIRWGAGLSGGWDRRDGRVGEESMRFDGQRLRVRLSLDAWPGTNIWVEGGATRTWVDDEGPDQGAEWLIGGDLHIFEQVLRESPVTGRREWIGLHLSGSYRRTRTETDDFILRWRESRAGLLARYGRVHPPEESLFQPVPIKGYTLRAGLMRTQLQGRFETDQVERIKNPDRLGFLLGTDFLWRSDWVTRFEALLFGSNTRDLTLSVSRFF